MVSSMSFTVRELCTSCFRRNLSSRDGFVLNSRNLGISQLGFLHNSTPTNGFVLNLRNLGISQLGFLHNSTPTNGFVLNLRNVGISQLGFSYKVGNNLLYSRKTFSSKTMEKSVNLVEHVSEEHSFTVSYLINSCGLSPEVAISASKKVKIKNLDNPDSVLAALREYGFENTHIAKLVSKDPSVLLAGPKSNLIPKLEYFRSLGFGERRLAEVCSSCPYVFNCSLKNRIIPCCDFLKSVLLDDTKVVSALTFSLFKSVLQRYFAPNVEILREAGATASMISYMLSSPAGIVTLNNSKFGVGLKEVIKLGFNPSKCSFVYALHAKVLMSKSKWEKKVKVYKCWGFSDNDISSAFRKNPVCMLISEKKIQEVMEYLVNELGLEPADVLRNTILFQYSLKKRLIPRCTVVRVLQLKGLVKKDVSFATCMTLSETEFLERFVKKYTEQAPELWSVYAGEMGLAELGFGSQEKH